MKISTKVEYGIAALIDIGTFSTENELVNAASISKRQNIPQKYLEQVLSPLRQAQLIIGIKGAKGGYLLGREAHKISITDILNVLDSSLITKSYEDGESFNDNMKKTIINNLWNPLESSILEVVNSVLLSDLIQHYKDNVVGDVPMFYI